MTQETMNDHEVISALADGQLRGDEFVRAMDLLESSPDHRLTWHAYHVAGDVMRMGVCHAIEKDGAFLQRLKSSLTQEPSIFDDTTVVASGSTESHLNMRVDSMPAGNDARFRWKAWSAIASVSAISIMAWQMFTGIDESSGLAQMGPSTASNQDMTLASSQAASNDLSVMGGQSLMIRDPRLDALLAAHHQSGGVSAFQKPTGFVRNATFTGAGR